MKTVMTIFTALAAVNFASGEILHVPEEYSSIMEALYSASSGDTVQVAPGVYERFMWSGTSLQDVHVLGAGAFGDSVSLITGSDWNEGVFFDDVVGWEVAGFEISHFYAGVVLECSYDLEIHHNYIHHNLQSYSYGIVIESCEGINIHHNVTAYNHYVAIRLNWGCENLSFINNTVVYTDAYHGFLIMEYIPGLEIINNIIAFNDDDGIQFAPGASQGDAVLNYNDNYGNGSNWVNCTPGIGNISLNPLFTNNPLSPYSLQASSPCIDTGDPNLPMDPDGTESDIGALYFNQTPPYVIEDLTISISLQDVLLDWEDVTHVRMYLIYRSPLPYFTPSISTLIDSTDVSNYTNYGALELGNAFYRIVYRN